MSGYSQSWTTPGGVELGVVVEPRRPGEVSIQVIDDGWLTPEGADWLTHLAWFGALIVALAWRTERPRRTRCVSCRQAARHAHRSNRPARLAWPGRNSGRLTFRYGVPPLHLDPPPECEATDTWPLNSPIPVPPVKRLVPPGAGKLTAARQGPLAWAWDNTGTATAATGPMAVGLCGTRRLEAVSG